MVDVSTTIAAKSDQLNADDLIGGPITIRVLRVTGNSDKEQPISVHYEGDQGKPYKPGKSMRRVLVNFWGKDGEAYVGRSMTLYRDPEVTFGKIKVGGIRISHMSDIDGGEMALAITKGAKRLFTVKRLQVQQQQQHQQQQSPKQSRDEQADAYIEAVKTLESALDIAEYQNDERRAKWLSGLRDKYPAIAERIDQAVADHREALAGSGEPDDAQVEPEPETGRDDADHGDQHTDDDDDFPGDR